MERILQRLVFPDMDRFKMHTGIFYRGIAAGFTEDGAQLIGSGLVFDAATYLNGFALNKWKLYTDLKGVSLTLKVKGDFVLTLLGYSMRPVVPERTEFLVKEYHLDEAQEITLEFPDSSEEMLAFEIFSLDKAYIYGGYYTGVYDSCREVNLAIATTTCFKEAFIKGNVKLIREKLLETDDEIRNHLYVNVVDNGRTLAKEDIEIHERIRLFPNINAGGSGGYARGMLESRHMDADITHVLLMDDDVLILPESIRRTYQLLSVLKEEYYDAYISGAMLDFNAMFLQHEDVGTIGKDGYLKKAKPDYPMVDLACVMNNNRELQHLDHPYAAWWYCCIPMPMLEKNGYPMPLFIRGDDVEYGLRSHTKFLTMGGICVWHMGFANKYNAFMNMYQSLRNLLIVQASSEDINDCDVIGTLDFCFRERLREFSYDSAELIVRALEDFLKGPSFIANADGEKIMKEYRQLNEKMTKLDGTEETEVRLEEVGDIRPLNLVNNILYKLTDNGHRFVKEDRLSDDIGVVAYDGRWQPYRQFFKKELLAVNPFDASSALRHIDPDRYRNLRNRYKKLRKEYDRRIGELRISYHQAKKHFVTEEFWRRYLGLDK